MKKLKTDKIELLKDKSGKPLVCYHYTQDKGYIAYPLSHYGTYLSAQERRFNLFMEGVKKTQHCWTFKEYARSQEYYKFQHPEYSSIIHSAPAMVFLKRLLSSPKSLANFLHLTQSRISLKEALSKDYRSLLLNLFIKTHPLTKEETIQKVYFKMKNPLPICDLNVHLTNTYQAMMYQQEVYKKLNNTFLMMHILKKCPQSPNFQKQLAQLFLLELDNHPLSKDIVFIFKDPYKMTPDQVRQELLLESIYKPSFKNNKKSLQENAHKLVYQRMIRHFEAQGYDGFIYQNNVEDKGQNSIIVFRPHQVVFQVNGELIMQAPALLPPQNQQKLEQIRQERLQHIEPQPLSKSDKFHQASFEFFMFDNQNNHER